jgi:hypothetical protein
MIGSERAKPGQAREELLKVFQARKGRVTETERIPNRIELGFR